MKVKGEIHEALIPTIRSKGHRLQVNSMPGILFISIPLLAYSAIQSRRFRPHGRTRMVLLDGLVFAAQTYHNCRIMMLS